MSQSQKRIEILIADEDSRVVEIIRSCFPAPRFHTVSAMRAMTALEHLKRNEFHVVICSMHLPGIEGLEFVRRGLSRSPQSAFLLLCEPSLEPIALEAKTRGDCDYILKPFNLDQIVEAVDRVLQTRRKQTEREIVSTLSEQTLHHKTGHLHQVLVQAGEIQRATLEVLVVALDARERQTNLHSLRVQKFTMMLAKKCGYRESGMQQLSYGALLHDIGKISIPDSILLKPSRLTPEETQIVQQHTKYGYQVLSRIPHLQDAAMLALLHHERLDGSGYPMGLQGDEIPFEARMFSIVDTMDVITAGRSYCPPRSQEEARAEILRCSGTQFDKDVIDVFLTIQDEEWNAAREEVAQHYQTMLPILQKPTDKSSISKIGTLPT